MMLTGSEIICECLIEQGVDTVFGYPGGTILNVYDALYRYQDKINHVLTSHEQGASHAADGYARATGKVGPYVLEQIDYLTDSNAIICTDVGQHQMWAAQYYHYRRPRQLITSGGAGTMGFGLGAAIGAKYGNPDFPVFNIAGDGCFRMNMNELATASRYNVPIIQVVINNKVLGMVRQWQTLFYGKRYSNTILDDKVDFCKVAEGLGCKAIRVSTKEEVAPAIKEALDTNGPVLIEVMIGKDDKVFPMVAPGGAISKAFDESDLKNK